MPNENKKHPGQNIEYLDFTVPEFEIYDRGWLWYVVLVVGFSFGLLVSIFQNDYRLAVIILLGAVIFYQLALANPKEVQVKMTRAGIHFKNRFYTWNKFGSFTLFGSNKHVTAHLEPLSGFAGAVVVPLPKFSEKSANKVSPEQENFVEVLNSFLPQKLHGRMSLGDWITRVLRF